jgi:hypothetical protein
MPFRLTVISVSYDAEAARPFDTALKNAGLFVSQLHSLQTAFIVIGHQKNAAVVFHACVPQEDVAVLSMLARWRSPRSRIVALHSVTCKVSPADIDFCVLDDPTTIVNCISDLIDERAGQINAMKSN